MTARDLATPLRLAVVTSRPVYYYAPLYRKLAAHPDLDLTVVYTTSIGLPDFQRDDRNFNHHTAEAEHLEGYDFVVLPGAERVRRLNGLRSSFNRNIIGYLWRERFDAVWIHGYTVGSNVAAALVQLLGVRGLLLLRDDQHLRNPRSAWKQRVKRAVLPVLFGRMRGLYVGSLNREWMEHFGFREHQLFFVPHTVDNDAIQARIAAARPRRAEIRASFGIPCPDTPVILLPGRLVWEKDHPTLLDAFRQVRSRHRCVLLMAGDGPERGRIEDLVREHAIPDVILAGQVEQPRMMEAYAAADILVLPSRSETWGLVVNEGMNAGLPVVVSNRVGCSVDLVRDDENGVMFETGNVAQLAHALESLVKDPECRARFGQRSLEVIADWTYDKAAAGALQSLGIACPGPAGKTDSCA